MPPTIQTNGRQGERTRVPTTEKRSDLVCKVKYNNSLPDIPFEPKFLVYPFDSTRYVQYNPTSLERAFKFELLTEHDLGVTIDLINPDTYRIDYNAELDPADEALLEDESSVQTDEKRSRHHNKNVSWLRKTEYISTEYNRFVQSALKSEARLGYSIKKHTTDEVLYKDRDSQIKAIKETFDHAIKPITSHYSKPGVTAVEILPMFPDFNMWKQPCAQVIFDSDPAQKGKSIALQNDEMSQAMIRGMVDEHGEQFVAYFLPTSETMEKHKRDVELGVDYEDNEEYDYVLASEYNWNVKNKSSRGYEENYFFVLKDEGIFYNELETRVRLSKRRKVGPSAASSAVKSRLIVKHRPLTDQELAQQDARVMMLEPPGEEDEELEHRHSAKTTEEERDEAKERRSVSPAGSTTNRAASMEHEGSPPPAKRSRRSESVSPRSERSDQSPVGSDRGSKAGSARSSVAGSAPGSPMGSAPCSPAGSASGSPAGSAPGSPAGSAPGSPAGSAPGSPAGSARSSPVHSARSSPAHSAHSSPARSNRSSRAGSGASSPAGSAGDMASDTERNRNEEVEIFGSDPESD